ncbi:MAG: hypothetical protein JSV99_00215 [Planctomycetota bacterium]|nr:MAG: hypothetical protein JSV99_00215 [Planctomycetota bacterium]
MPAQSVLWLLRRGLGHRYLPLILAVAAFVIMLPALKAGLITDDLIHRSILVEPSELPERLHDSGMIPEGSGKLSPVLCGLFGAGRTDSDVKNLKDSGILPWWTYDGLRAFFWRPLTGFTHWVDYRLFPDSPALMHAHSLIWFAAVVFLVTVLYRRLLGPVWLAGLAAILYLLDENSYLPAMFIANRNVLVALVFGILAVLAHHRWRTTGSLPTAVAACFFLLCSLLSAEAGIATFAYIFAYAAIMDNGSWVRRGISLAPALIVIVLWRIIYNALGYGFYGSGMYLDPVREPLQYALAVLQRGPVLLMGLWSWQSPDLLCFVNDSVRMQAWLVSVIYLAVVFVILVPLLRTSRLARFWFVAMLLSVLPVCAVIPTSRNLIFVAIAGFALIAQFIGYLLARESWLPKSHLWRAPAWGLCLILLIVHVPMAVGGRIISPKMTSFVIDTMKVATQVGSSEGLENQDLIVVNAPNPLAFTFAPFVRAYEGEPLPRATRILAPGFNQVEIIRTGNRSILLEAREGNLLEIDQQSELHFVNFFEQFNGLFRSERFGMHAGEQISLPRLTVEIVAVDARGLPTQVLFRFAAALEDPSLCWLEFDWEDGCYHPFEVPAIGESTEVPGPRPVAFGEAMDYLIKVLFSQQ